MAIDPRELRRCLGHFATGVTVITCGVQDGAPHGATVNAFTAVSLEPPLVLVSLDRRSKLCSLLEADRPFTVNVLEAAQKELALHFAGRPNQDVVWDADSDVRRAAARRRAGAHLVHAVAALRRRGSRALPRRGPAVPDPPRAAAAVPHRQVPPPRRRPRPAALGRLRRRSRRYGLVLRGAVR